MGSAAMGGSGNMALGYSASAATSVFPSIRYTARFAGDPLNQMTQGEGSVVAGAGSQNGSFSRWGDYSAMSVDPSDDQTFWYTQEYYQASSAAGWQTRIGSFKLGSSPVVTTGGSSGIGPTSATASGTLNPSGQSTTYHFDYGPTATYGSQAPAAPDPNAGSSSSDQTVFATLTGLATNTTYHYRLVATNASGTTQGQDRTLTTTKGYRDAILATPGLVSYWRLGERSGTTAADQAGGNAGAYTGGVTLGAPGAVTDGDTAALFDGSSGYVNVPSSANLALTGDMTSEAWVKPTDYGNYNGIVGKTRGNLPAPYDFYLSQGSGVPTFLRGDGTWGQVGVVSGSNAPPVGRWSHIVVTVSGNTVTHYLNGVQNGSGTLTSTGQDAGTALRIGSRNDLVTMFKGGIDEVAVYGAALTPTQVSNHYNVGTASP
jgi:hypothetical protein